SWQLSDSYGTGSELIPPTSTTVTYNDDTGRGQTAMPVTWHTAPETHAKVISFAGAGAVSDPSTVSWGSNRIDYFVRGADNAIWHNWWNNGWGSWQSLGGNMTSAPDASSWGANRIDLVAKGTDSQLWHQSWNGSTWQGSWDSLGAPPGGQITSDPSAVSWGSNRIDVFARGPDNALWHKAWAP